jgi:hypothetical protein
MVFTEKELEALIIFARRAMDSDPWGDLLDADWSDADADAVITSIKKKLKIKGGYA